VIPDAFSMKSTLDCSSAATWPAAITLAWLALKRRA